MTNEQGARKSKALTIVLGVAVFVLLLAVIFLASPLKEAFFPSRVAPGITLEILEGPDLEGETGLNRYLVEAVVTGHPSPDVLFNRNDGIGEVEKNQTLVLLAEGESFLLRATASNALGSTDVTLELFGEAESGDDEDTAVNGDPDEGDEDESDGEPDEVAPANQPPVISGLTFSTSPLYAGEEFSVTAQATDPDEDPLSFEWWLNGVIVPGSSGTMMSPLIAPGDYELRVVVSDSRGGEAEHSETVVVNALATLFPTPISSENGFIIRDFMAFPGGNVYAGDNSENRICRGYISFDTGSLAEARVHKVELRLADPHVLGDPSFMHAPPAAKPRGLWIEVVVWPARPLQLSDYTLLGNQISAHTNYDITRTSVIGGTAPKLAEALQTYLDAGYTRFKLRLRFERELSNNNNADDGVRYDQGNIYLKVWHEFEP